MFGINWLLRKFNLSPNAYYNYKKHRRNAIEKQKASILKCIKELYYESDGRPGYRMMQKLLLNKGIVLSLQTVRKYMNVELKLKSVTRKPKHHYHKGSEAYAVSNNLLQQDFFSKKKNEKWCIDFTYIYFGNRHKRYNCTIIDIYDRRVVASVNGAKIDSKLAIATVSKALERCDGETGMILHSDQGSQFTSKEFTEFCITHGVVQSMSKSGCPYDNAPMERYFNTLKAELLNQHNYQDEETLYREINCYAYGWYNNLRPHSFNGGIPPAKVV